MHDESLVTEVAFAQSLTIHLSSTLFVSGAVHLPSLPMNYSQEDLTPLYESHVDNVPIHPWPVVTQPAKYLMQSASVLLEVGAVRHVFLVHLVESVKLVVQGALSIEIIVSQLEVYLSHVSKSLTQFRPLNLQAEFPATQFLSEGSVILSQEITAHFEDPSVESSTHYPSEPLWVEHPSLY